jgi:L-threonylcarbamoyladenylate synthase
MTSPPLTLHEAAIALQSGGVIAYPTEAVWGLGCDPRDENTVLRLLAIKQRPVEKGLILIASHLDQLRPFLDLAAVPTDHLAAVLATWPGPHTWVMPASADAPRWITGAHEGIAVRISAHPTVIALCNAFEGALVSTSANLSGSDAPRSREGLDPAVLAAVAGSVAGETGGLRAPTTIRDALTGIALRP